LSVNLISPCANVTQGGTAQNASVSPSVGLSNTVVIRVKQRIPTFWDAGF
jgi:hypothetical protein